jgi:hypothetical protein
MRLTERGFERKRRTVGFFWLGIGLLDTQRTSENEGDECSNVPYEPYEPDFRINENPKNSFHVATNRKVGSYGS